MTFFSFLLIFCLAIADVISTNSQGDNECAVSYSYKTCNTACETYIEKALKNALNQGLESDRLNDMKEFEKYQKFSSNCLHEKLSELKYQDLLMNGTSLSVNDYFDSNKCTATLVCIANITLNNSFNNLIEEIDNATQNSLKNKEAVNCLKKYFYNNTLSSADLQGFDCSESESAYDCLDLSEKAKSIVAAILYDKIATFKKLSTKREKKQSTISKFFFKIVILVTIFKYATFYFSNNKK